MSPRLKKAVTDAYRGGGAVTLEIDTKANLMESTG